MPNIFPTIYDGSCIALFSLDKNIFVKFDFFFGFFMQQNHLIYMFFLHVKFLKL